VVWKGEEISVKAKVEEPPKYFFEGITFYETTAFISLSVSSYIKSD